METSTVELKYTPSSPVSPRPWYKRQTPQREHHILKNNERKKDKNKVEDWILESGFPRRINNSTDSKFNIFTKLDKSEDKRRSQISILTNISELDREAAEIIQKGKEREKALIASHDAMFYTNHESEDEKEDSPDVELNVDEAEVQKKTSARELISLFNAITNVTKVTVNTSFFSKEGIFKKENGKRSSLFLERRVHEEAGTSEHEQRKCIEEDINFQEIKKKSTQVSVPKIGYRAPDIVVTENDVCSTSTGSSEGKITKVTIEELDEYDAERNSKVQAMYEAHRLIRHQSPPIPTITEVSESSFKSSPASTLKSITSESTSSESPSPVQQSATSAGHKSQVWVCPRCTLENLRWRITCEVCDIWRPIPCEFKEQSQGKYKSSHLPILKIVEKTDEKKEQTNVQKPLDDSIIKTNSIIRDELIEREKVSDKTKVDLKLLQIETLNQGDTIPYVELTEDAPSTSKVVDTVKIKPGSSIQSQPLPALPIDCNENSNLSDFKTEEVRQARLAFFNKNKQKHAKEETVTKECQTLVEKTEKNSFEMEDNKMKLREMLKEMKHSLPKRPKFNQGTKSCNENKSEKPQENLGAISKIPSLSVKSIKEDEIMVKKNDEERKEIIRCDDNELAEAYLVESETIVEEIHYKKPPEKVSSSVQTSAQVKAVPVIAAKPTPREVIVPITVEEYQIKDGVLYTSITKKAKRIGTGTFHLMRPRDFANIEAIKTSDKAAAHVYANVSNNECIQSTSSPEQNASKPSPILSNKFTNQSLENLSLQLTKPLGIASFRAGLAQGKENNNMNTLAVNRLLRRLESAIAGGLHELAAALATELAQMQINCSVIRQKPETPTSMIQVDLFVEDRTSHQGPIVLSVRPSMTVQQLKQKIERDFEIPSRVQRWILGKMLANDDNATLESMGVETTGTPIFLYLVDPEVAKDAGVSTEIVEVEEAPSPNGVPEPFLPVKEDIPPDLQQPSTSYGKTMLEPVYAHTSVLGWKCGACTLVNSPSVLHCAVCTAERTSLTPVEYVASDNEAIRLEIEKQMELEAFKKAEEEEKEKDLNYKKLIDMAEKDDLIIYPEDFECPVCLMECEPLNGVVLRECLHVFCKQCLAQAVEYSDEAEVKCPFRDNNYTCDSTLLEREIKALVSPEKYEQHLAKSIALAETKIGNAFHCKTPDCRGWCIYEDNVNTFRCPVCTHNNCLTCQAIHEGLDCKQFQEQLNKDSDTNAESRRTKEMLQEMVDRGEAMNCPTCQVILMKKWGCDWLKCSMCKTEICWITRGPRWGPNGKGDTSGGCQCGVNGIKCHPKCTYCH